MKAKRFFVFIMCVFLLCLSGCDLLNDEILQDIFEGTTVYSVEDLEVHYIDVGQADSTLVICNNETMLIDGGNANDSSLIYAYLEEHDVSHIDYMICTHAHEDHVGGLSGALNYASVGTVYAPTVSCDSKAFKDFVKYVKERNASITVPQIGTSFNVGGAECTIIGVNTVDSSDTNNTSIVIHMVYGDTAFLFCGDAEQIVEKSILESGEDISCDVIKVPHHGSSSSLSYMWLNEADPEYAVISVGKDNSYGHPHEETISKLKDAGIKVFRTDMQGHIICYSDGNTVRFSTERNYSADTLK